MTGPSSSSNLSHVPPTATAVLPKNGEEEAGVIRTSPTSISLLRPPIPMNELSARNCQKRSIGSQTQVGAMVADEGKVKIELFDGADFGFWKMQIEDYLYQKKLYQPLSENKPEGMNDEDWTLLDRQALRVIRLMLSRNVAFNIAKEKTTVGQMAALSSMHEKPSASNKLHLMRRLFNLQMTEGASVA
ncbi:hypothetical protein L3X38_041577 [Prunus dulcis]|uniref:Retrovirus-related Pol polyprotein from transposon TNT 1-94 n=1 Tax=Prunus dulcis TaxID=3755 RepID=A0AAD4UTB1_PRUDU|nr:hypothetical protein L3X38_041577 [Prunus dulcis]